MASVCAVVREEIDARRSGFLQFLTSLSRGEPCRRREEVCRGARLVASGKRRMRSAMTRGRIAGDKDVDGPRRIDESARETRGENAPGCPTGGSLPSCGHTEDERLATRKTFARFWRRWNNEYPSRVSRLRLRVVG
jgi:hypothetical protein